MTDKAILEAVARALCARPELWPNRVTDAQAAINAYEAAQPDTHVLVPRRPTYIMEKAAEALPFGATPAEVFKAMIAAHEGETE